MGSYPTSEQIRSIIRHAHSERSRALGDLIIAGAQAAWRLVTTSCHGVRQARSLSGARNPAALRILLQQYERNPG